MKCIHCNTDSTYRDRVKNERRCKACKHPFAFEPRSSSLRVTDGMMQHVIAGVSGDGAVAFTARNLWYEMNRRLLRGSVGKGLLTRATGWLGTGGLILAALIALPALFSGNVPRVLIGALLAAGAFVVIRAGRQRRRRGGRPEIGYDTFRARYLERWNSVHGASEKLLPPPTPAPAATPRPVEPDVTGYSFDRAVITDRAETAALLLANNFHFENNCAVLSVDGHPETVFETVMTMLRRNPTLTVFALHDASPAGCALPRRIREPGWFPQPSVRVVDLGLRPRQAEQLGLIRPKVPRPTLAEEQRAALTLEEIAWFESGEIAEIAALRPARLMRSVFQGFAAANRSGGDGASSDGGDGGFFIWSYSDRADVYASDSFG